MSRHRYQIVWDNGDGGATDSFPQIYTNRRTAERAGRAWVREMEADDTEGKGQYTFDVVAVDE